MNPRHPIFTPLDAASAALQPLRASDLARSVPQVLEAGLATRVPCVSDGIAISELLVLMDRRNAAYAMLCKADGGNCRLIARDDIEDMLGELRGAAERAVAAIPPLPGIAP